MTNLIKKLCKLNESELLFLQTAIAQELRRRHPGIELTIDGPAFRIVRCDDEESEATAATDEDAVKIDAAAKDAAVEIAVIPIDGNKSKKRPGRRPSAA